MDTETVAGQRQRQLHDADRLHAADDGHGDGDLPVGRQLQRRQQQQRRQRTTTTAEQVTVSPGQPDDQHHAQRPAVTLGTHGSTLKDTASLSGGYDETGTITFTLYLGSTLVDSDQRHGQRQRQVHAPGYTLPTTGTVTGTYQWTPATAATPTTTSVSGRRPSRRRAGDGRARPARRSPRRPARRASRWARPR